MDDSTTNHESETVAKSGPERHRTGMGFAHTFSQPNQHPFAEAVGKSVSVVIPGKPGEPPVYRQDHVWAPEGWSENAINITASKYFYGDAAKGDDPSTGGRECSIPNLIGRVCGTIAQWGWEDEYFAHEMDRKAFEDDLVWLCLNQHAAFNSPVWFNVGLYHAYGINGPANGWRWSHADGKAVPVEDAYKYPQASACFIQSVSDDMESICDLATSEMMLFKYGSGTGTDLSTLRSTREKLSGGGKPSGPVSFLRVYDAGASVVKSGGKTRRAAKMNTLKCHHPDIVEFIECKSKEDRKARALIAAGYSDRMTGSPDEAYSSVMFQNANLSVRVTDAFMAAATAVNDESAEWWTTAVQTGERVERHDAREILDKIAQGTWECGDPGVQYEDTIQRWHTIPNTGPINSSNPCSEYMHIDDSACNLASINLMKFRREDGTFDEERFRAAVRILITAQEILVDRASYPTRKIAENSHRFRPLGLGYANLGALLMSLGLAYDSDEGRGLAGAITAIMHGQAYLTSAELAKHRGPFEGFAENRWPMLGVVGKHAMAVDRIHRSAPRELVEAARKVWDKACRMGDKHGFRNSQVTVLAPTGTIAFMMDCDTTGIEPDTALVKYKSLAGGGFMKIVNRTAPLALRTLGYDDASARRIVDHIEAHDTIIGAPGLREAHLPVFDCAFPPPGGGRSIDWRGHLRMMAAVQPFLSGAISKTVNMPESSTVSEIRDAYVLGWELGLKAVAIYRDGSKGQQPLTTRKADDSSQVEPAAVPAAEVEPDPDGDTGSTVEHWYIGGVSVPVDGPVLREPGGRPIGSLRELSALANQHAEPRRERLPETRQSLTHKFTVGGHEGYVTVGFYPDGRPGELFIKMAKEGSTIGGLMDQLGTAISIGLQYGVPLEVFIYKLAFTRFEPSGPTYNPDVPFARSLADYLGRWLGCRFVPGFREEHSPHREPASIDAPTPVPPADIPPPLPTLPSNGHVARPARESDMICPDCGAIMIRTGACHGCPNCGFSGGCG